MTAPWFRFCCRLWCLDSLGQPHCWWTIFFFFLFKTNLDTLGFACFNNPFPMHVASAIICCPDPRTLLVFLCAPPLLRPWWLSPWGGDTKQRMEKLKEALEILSDLNLARFTKRKKKPDWNGILDRQPKLFGRYMPHEIFGHSLYLQRIVHCLSEVQVHPIFEAATLAQPFRV